jgi:hypothetical protein
MSVLALTGPSVDEPVVGCRVRPVVRVSVVKQLWIVGEFADVLVGSEMRVATGVEEWPRSAFPYALRAVTKINLGHRPQRVLLAC